MLNAQIMSVASPRERPCRLKPAYMELMLYHPLPQGLHTKLHLGCSAGFWSSKKKILWPNHSPILSVFFYMRIFILYCILEVYNFLLISQVLTLKSLLWISKETLNLRFWKMLAIDPLLDELMDYKMWMWFWGLEVECYDLKWYIWYWIDRK